MSFRVGEQVVALAKMKGSGGNKVKPGWQGHCIAIGPKQISFSFEIKHDSLFGNIQGFTTVILSHDEAVTKVSGTFTGSNQTHEQPAPQIPLTKLPANSPQEKNISTSEIIEKLTQLKSLKESGMLSEEEFNNLKTELMPRNTEEDLKNSVLPNAIEPDSTDIRLEDDGRAECFIWITKKPLQFSSENYERLFEILDLPKFADGIAPKLQKDVFNERKRLLDLSPLLTFRESSMKPARFNRPLDLKTANRIISRLKELGLTAEIREVSSIATSTSNHSNSKSSSSGILYDVWVTGIGSFKITNESTVEVGKLIDPTQQLLFIDSLEHNLEQLKKGTRTQVLITTKISGAQSQMNRLRLEELGLIVKVERNYSN